MLCSNISDSLFSNILAEASNDMLPSTESLWLSLTRREKGRLCGEVIGNSGVEWSGVRARQEVDMKICSDVGADAIVTRRYILRI